MWALVATFIKATTDTLTQFGVGGMFTHWPVYALAVGSVAALFLEQAALHVGPLRAQPFLVIIDPIVNITLSVWLLATTSPPAAPWRRPPSPWCAAESFCSRRPRPSR